jgi:hypothetical protein
MSCTRQCNTQTNNMALVCAAYLVAKLTIKGLCVCVPSGHNNPEIFLCRLARKKCTNALTHNTLLGFALRLQGSSPGSDVSMGYFNM